MIEYRDPHPDKKGTDLVRETCMKCGGTGVYVGHSSITWKRGDAGEAPWCFDCNGVGYHDVRVSSIRARVRREVKRAEEMEREAVEALREAARREQEVTEWISNHTDVWQWLAEHAERSRFAFDLIQSLNERGSLSDRQVEAVRKAIARDEATATGADVPEGRETVTGEVVTLKEVEDNYSPYGGTIIKMVVLDDRGFKVYGTRPSSLAGVDRGSRVTFTAALAPSDDDPKFGFFKRPTKAATI